MKCPHCGNTDPETIESNGESERSLYLVLLCVARVKPGEDVFGGDDALPTDRDGLVACSATWEPNS